MAVPSEVDFCFRQFNGIAKALNYITICDTFLSIKNVDRNRGQNAIRKTNAIINREISCEYSFLIALTPETSFRYKCHKLCKTVFEVYLCRIVT